jgi:hypothetical protein
MAKLPKYKVTISDEYSDGEDLGWNKTAFTSKPAILIAGVALAAQDRPAEMFFADKLKYQIAAPIMIPMEIYRNDAYGEYYVEFTEADIEKIHSKKMKNLSTNKGLFNLEHSETETVPAYLSQVWIVEDPERDKSFSTYGVKVPKGTLFGVAQITDKPYYHELVANGQTGFSIEGFLGLSLQDIEAKQNKQKLNKTEMNEKSVLPEGTKFQIEDKWYEIKDGQIVESIVEEEVALEEEVIEEEVALEEVVEEEVALEEVVEEEVALEEEVVEEEMAEEVVPADSYTKEEVDAKLDEIYKMLADMKVEEVVEDSVPEAEVAMSIHDRLAAFTAFSSKK